MFVHKSIRLRLYPNRSQERQLNQIVGNCRWLWNYLLHLNKERYEQEGKFVFHKEMSAMLPRLKQEFEWLTITPAISLQQVTKNLDRALRYSFTSSKGFPKFKKKSHTQGSFYVSNQVFKILGNTVKLSKTGSMRFRSGRLPEGRILSGTVSKDGDHWYISVLYEQELDIIQQPIDPATAIGLDLGIKELVVTSDGEVLSNPKFLKKSSKRMKRLQRQASKSENGSNNRRKKNLKVYRLHRKIRNQRKDYIHKFTTSLIAKNSLIVCEDLNVKGMMKNRKLSKAISDVGWSEITRQLEYKTRWNGSHFINIGRFEPSSQLCSSCGSRQKMPLYVRTYSCSSCGLVLDRDLNAAINIRNIGLETVRRGTPEPVVSLDAAYACGDTTDGVGSCELTSHVSMKQEVSCR